MAKVALMKGQARYACGTGATVAYFGPPVIGEAYATGLLSHQA